MIKSTMADERTKNTPTGTQKSEPKIRTMKSDIAEFMKETKPSLLQILTKQVEYQPVETEEKKRPLPIKPILIGILAATIIGGSALAVYFYLITGRPAVTTPTVKEIIPNSPIFVEKTQAATSLASATQLEQIIAGAAQNIERPQSLKRLIIKIKQGGDEHLITPKDFFEIMNIHPPQQILDSLGETLFINIYYATDGPKLVLIAPSRNAGRTFAGMLGWENSMQRDLDILFLNETVNQIIAPFVDKTFRNIDYRILNIKPGTDLGYFIFQAKNLLVITTSEEALQVVINRLFETR